MLRIMNEERGTHYNLGFITRGYRGRYQLRMEAAAARRQDQKARQAQAYATNAAAGRHLRLLPLPKYPLNDEDYRWDANLVRHTTAYVDWQNTNGAVVWIYTNNSDAISAAHTGSHKVVSTHWEGMAPRVNRSDYGQRIVESFGLQNHVANAVDHGLYRITHDAAFVSNAGNQEWVRTGHFVTFVREGEEVDDHTIVMTGGEEPLLVSLPNDELDRLM